MLIVQPKRWSGWMLTRSDRITLRAIWNGVSTDTPSVILLILLLSGDGIFIAADLLRVASSVSHKISVDVGLMNNNIFHVSTEGGIQIGRASCRERVCQYV